MYYISVTVNIISSFESGIPAAWKQEKYVPIWEPHEQVLRSEYKRAGIGKHFLQNDTSNFQVSKHWVSDSASELR